MIKVQWCRLQQCLGTFTMLLVEGLSKLRLLTHLYAYVFESLDSERQNLWGSYFFSKYPKFKLDFKNAAKNFKNVFCFWDDCIWIGIVKLSLLTTGYFSSAANVLTSSPKILHINKRDFFQFNGLGKDQIIWKRSCDADFTVLGDVCDVPCRGVLWGRNF